MVATPVTPGPGLAYAVVTGGTAINAVAAAPNGGFIQNPASTADQGLGTAEDLFVNAVGAAILGGYGNTFRIPPGGTWNIIPGQTTTTSVNAVSSGHRFSITVY